MSYRTVTLTVAEESATEAATAWQDFEDGRYDRTTLVAILARLIGRHRARAYLLADLFVAGQLDRLPVGIEPADDLDRLLKASETVVAAGTRGRATRLARAEPLAAGQDAALTAYRQHGVGGWVRRTDADPCPLCTTLADGQVRPPSVPFARHPGCSCIPQPVTR